MFLNVYLQAYLFKQLNKTALKTILPKIIFVKVQLTIIFQNIVCKYFNNWLKHKLQYYIQFYHNNTIDDKI